MGWSGQTPSSSGDSLRRYLLQKPKHKAHENQTFGHGPRGRDEMEFFAFYALMDGVLATRAGRLIFGDHQS